MRQIFTLIICLCIFSGGFAQVIFKNTGTSKVHVAICYFTNGAWTSKGWYTIEPNEQKPLYNFTILNNTNFYYYATIENCDKVYTGSSPLYVDVKNSFTIPNADRNVNYASSFIQKYNFIQINLRGRSNFVIELKPKNLTCYGKPQGKWRLSLDRDGNYAEKQEDAVYYREITFEQGRPLGWCKDYYSDGKLKADFKLINYSPVVYDGNCKWYNGEGSIEKEETYKNGIKINATLYSANGDAEKKTANYEVIQLPKQNFYLNSTSNETWRGGSSKSIYAVDLPEGTVEWYYEFTASRDINEVKANTQLFSLVSKLTSFVDKTGILSTSINAFTAPPGGSLCNVYLMDGKYYNSFLSNSNYKHYPVGSRLNYNSGIVQIRGLSISHPMIGIKNPDEFNGIHVSLHVVAIVSKID